MKHRHHRAAKSNPRGKAPQKHRRTNNRSSSSDGSSMAVVEVDPRRVRFAHARIKPVFSGCGRTLAETAEALRCGATAVGDIPLITVMVHPRDAGNVEEMASMAGNAGPWFFSLNNRRLYVFKLLREEGVLDVVPVRVRAMKDHEVQRYTETNCTLTARFLFPTPRPAADAEAAEQRSGAPPPPDQPDQQHLVPG